MRKRIGALAALLAVLVWAPVGRASGGGNNLTELRGVVQSRPATPAGDWIVGGRAVHVSPATVIKEELAAAIVGATVQVKGSLRADGSLDATTMEVVAAAPGGPPAPEETRFLGTVQSLPTGNGAGDWTVAGRTVHVGTSTLIRQTNGILSVGATVLVEGSPRPDGSVDARSIEVRAGAPAGGTPPAGAVEFRGAIEQLPAGGGAGDWRISGRTVHVSAMTILNTEGLALVVGAFVEVLGTSRADGSVDASSIEVKFSPGTGTGAIEFSGAIDALSSAPDGTGDWTVSGKTVHVSAVTRLDREEGTFALGSFVEVKGTPRSDGTLDASRIELLWGPADSGAVMTSSLLIPSSAHRQGKNGSFFTTSLTLANPGRTAVEVEIHFLGHDRDGRQAEVQKERLEPGETKTLDDVVGTRFSRADDFGALRVVSNSGNLIVTSRTSTPGFGGTFGQDVPAARRDDLIDARRERSIAGIRQDDSIRTNLVVANATESTIRIQMELFDGGGRRVGLEGVELQPLEMKQFNNIAGRLGAAGSFGEGRLVLSTSTPDGAFAAFASQIDNGTNDPVTLLPR